MSRIIGSVNIDGVEIHITRQEPGYGDSFGWAVDFAQETGLNYRDGCTGFDQPHEALQAAILEMGLLTSRA